MRRWIGCIAWAATGAWPAAAGAQALVGENGTGVFVEEAAWTTRTATSSTIREAARSGESLTLTGRATAGSVPARYVVRRGDTLWDICGAKFRNPWVWPQVWALNPEITNPHWIYPGQTIRLRRDAGVGPAVAPGETLWGGAGGTIYFRNEGFIEKELEDPPGTIAASWEDEMMLSYPDLVYVRFREDFPVEAGQQYTIYRIRETIYDTVEDEEGDPVELGRIVEILGTGTILSFDVEGRLARVRVIESINPIERGDSIGPVTRHYVISEPRAAEVDLDGQIVASLRPRDLLGAGFIVFVNRGYEAGVRDGNRFQIIRANDHYLASRGMDIPVHLPFEWVGECQVIEARRTASTCLVTASRLELAVGDRVTLIRGQ